ncbi:hypothetical protein [Roseococcus pinisoli]|uniref:Uncharacterized protein n=1 Tax=Roseococcus pinisoli TaxID=2835040 RepID=A0ABS5QGQ1_9PROT|nr:hypothetical protein [Roseococcus pinisoli]MBS7812862.1 hypothetical protein [Roseococcus pinisoli]
MPTIHTITASGSFMPTLEAQTDRQKAEAQKADQQRRMDRLPSAAKGWADRHTLPEMELLGLIVTAYKASGLAPVMMDGSFAQRLQAAPDDIRRRLAELIASDAVTKTERIQAPAVFHPNLKVTVATKDEAPFSWLSGAAMGVRYRA